MSSMRNLLLMQMLNEAGADDVASLYKDIDTPSDLLNFFDKYFKYSFVDNKTGKRYKDYDDRHKVMSPDKLLKYQAGVCCDFVELEREWFDTHGFISKVVYVAAPNIETNTYPAHTFLVYNDGASVYWFEWAWGKYEGIHKFRTEADAIARMRNIFAQENNADVSDVIVSNVIQPPPFNTMTCMEYTSWATVACPSMLNESTVLLEAGENPDDESATEEDTSDEDENDETEESSSGDDESNNVGQQTSDTPTEGEAPEIPDLGDPPGSTDGEDDGDGDFSIDGDVDSDDGEDESDDDESSESESSDDGDNDSPNEADEDDLNSATETNYQTTVLELNKLDRQLATRKLFNLFQEMERNVVAHTKKIESSETVRDVELRRKTVEAFNDLSPLIRDYMKHKFRFTGYEENFQMYSMLASEIVQLNNTLAEDGF